MPSDPRMEMALRVLAGSIERYRSAVVGTAEEVRGYLASKRTNRDSAGSGVAATLGKFAADRIDFERFASLLKPAEGGDPETLERVEKAFDVLRLISTGGEDIFTVNVRPGTRLRDAVARKWSEVGRAFAAARLAGAARAGNRNSGTADELLQPMGFERWSVAERNLAPSLAIEVDGADLRATDLTEFLDGSVKMVLVVRGEAPPAPLVRLITPSTFVLQTSDETGLDRFAQAKGPAVAALLPDGAARFIHDPAAGSSPWSRIELQYAPEGAPKRAVGAISVWQQLEELEQLKALAAGPAGGAGGAEDADSAAAAPANPVDQLAAWLLSQADLRNLE